MKLVIVLFAVVAAASAHPGIIHPYVEPVQQYVPAYHPPVVQAYPAKVYAPPKYYKIAAAVPQVQVKQYVSATNTVHAAPQIVHAINVPQPAPIPPVHPQPLNLKVHSQAVRIPLGGVKIAHPHLIGIESYVPEPEIKVVKSHHPW